MANEHEPQPKTTTHAQRIAPPGTAIAEVLAVVNDAEVMLRTSADGPSEVVPAELALPHYRPAPGDRVLVCAAGDALYVIGALGAARTRALPLADGHLRVVAGEDGAVRIEAASLEIHSTAEISLEAPLVRTSAGRAELEARTIVESSELAYRHASTLSTLTAGRARTCVSGENELSAERTSIVSTEDTTIDGKRVLLG